MFTRSNSDCSAELIAENDLIDHASMLVTALKANLESHRLWLRRSSGVDLIIGGHLRRATMALESTIALAKSGAGYDAAATARIVLEHALSASSIAFAEDPEREAYLFITRQWRHIRDSDSKLRSHYPDLAAPNDEVATRVQQLIDQVDGIGVGERLGAIVKRLDAKDASGKKLFSWLFDVPYSALSNYVHARALGLRTIVPPLGQPFTFEAERNPRFAVNAVRQGMIGYLAMMLAVHQVWASDDGLKQILLDPVEDFIKRAGPAGEMGVYEL